MTGATEERRKEIMDYLNTYEFDEGIGNVVTAPLIEKKLIVGYAFQIARGGQNKTNDIYCIPLVIDPTDVTATVQVDNDKTTIVSASCPTFSVTLCAPKRGTTLEELKDNTWSGNDYDLGIEIPGVATCDWKALAKEIYSARLV